MAYHALKDAGHDPEVKLSYGLGALPGFVNKLTSGRREVKELTGNYWVPVLVLDDGTVIQGSRKIIAWAGANPPGSGASSAGGSSASGGSATVAGSASAGGSESTGSATAG
jgi:hypothetical protein